VELLIDIVSWTLLLSGSFFAITGGIGLLRLPDFYCRMHGGGITDTMGATLILTGLMFQSGLNAITLKLILILFFLLVTSPTAGHALAKAALASGLKPQLEQAEDEPSKN
jgi:multicomponent Na+:H+ antiporter subunit G